ncbi:MAG: DUF4105 domain-containing protein [Muribaculaceae bacterium]|nr:DUF4105 domain-containing protein [Muribaculaceae bacterium]
MATTIVIVVFWLLCGFQPSAAQTPGRNDTVISLITCYPGADIYELCGHSAIRVRGEGIDSVWNYGIFDFNQPNFVYRFVKGATDYKGASYPFAWFMPEYIQTHRKVVEQDLNLTPKQRDKMLSMLRKSVEPENAVYRYNYIKDNCSTRILNQIDSTDSGNLIIPDSAKFGTYRNAMRAYHHGYPWYQFGIDLALGSGLDQNIGSREEMFVPVELMETIGKSRFQDGRPVVKATRILNAGSPDAVLPPTPWWLSPLFWAWLLTIFIGWIVATNIIRGMLTKGIYVAWFTLLGLAGCIVAFLVFISEHESTNPNVLIFWLNPFQFLLPLAILIRSIKKAGFVMACYNIVACSILLISSPFISQSLNPAFFPLLLSTLGLAAAYAIINNKSSYKRR